MSKDKPIICLSCGDNWMKPARCKGECRPDIKTTVINPKPLAGTL